MCEIVGALPRRPSNVQPAWGHRPARPQPGREGRCPGPTGGSSQATLLLAVGLGARPAESDGVRAVLPTPAPRPLPKVSTGPW